MVAVNILLLALIFGTTPQQIDMLAIEDTLFIAMIESYQVDTTKHDAKFSLIKRYGLTQFDSGVYTIPRQKITKPIFS